MIIRTKRMRSVIFIGNLLFSIAGAITLYTNSSFIEEAFGERAVTFVYAISAALTIIALTLAGKILRKIGNRGFFGVFSFIYTLSLLLIIFTKTPLVNVLACITYFVASNILVYSFNVFFKGVTTDKKQGQARGTFLLLTNSGVLFGPMIGAMALSVGGFTATYMLSIGVFIISALFILIGTVGYIDADYTEGSKDFMLHHAFTDVTVKAALIGHFILQFFYAWMIVYTPIYLSQSLGFSWDTMGVMFTIMLLPFSILDYPLGKVADAMGSEKELAAIGFLIMICSVLGIAFIPNPTVIGMTTLLFFSRVGAATVEAMTEIHFFKVVRESDTGLLSLYADLRPISFIIAPLIALVLFYFFPFNIIFIALAIILAIGLVSTLHMETRTAWWQRSHEE